ncbi:hydrogenase maturation protease [Arthrobacter sp. NA-172]|uniref:hydrogenase maturation protease n=1 Tax=Arthrobacter sp. NA-172 TaxID=3367524 RepID=UPI0037543A9A
MNSGVEPIESPAGFGQAAARVLVAGVGNIFLRDDGFGPEVARRLAGDSRLSASGVLAAGDLAAGVSSADVSSAGASSAGVRVVDYGIRGMHLAYDLLDGVDVLVLVDAVPSADADAAAGSLRVMRIRQEDLDLDAALDPHGMNPAAVLGRLRTLGGELPTTYVVGCVPADVSEGIGLSDPVTAAVPGAVAAVVSLLTGHTLDNPSVTA